MESGKLSIEEKAAQFDAHFPSPKPNSQKSRRATRRGSVAMMQNLKDLCHAQGHQEESKNCACSSRNRTYH